MFVSGSLGMIAFEGSGNAGGSGLWPLLIGKQTQIDLAESKDQSVEKCFIVI